MKKHFFVAMGIVSCLALLAGCGKDKAISTGDAVVSVSTETEIENGTSDSVSDAPEQREEEFSVSEDMQSVILGKYEQDNNETNGKEPIEWIVVDTKDNQALVVSKYIIDCQPFNEGFSECSWESSSIRKWLNNDFFNQAFNQSEQERIVMAFVPDADAKLLIGTNSETLSDEVESNEAEDDETGNDESGNNETGNGQTEIVISGTEDYIFLLSDFEVVKYLPDDENMEGDEAYCKPTEYAKQHGVWTMSEELYNTRYGEDEITRDCIGAGWWWLRTVLPNGTKAIDIDTTGEIRVNGHDVGECHDGIRPAMWIKLD